MPRPQSLALFLILTLTGCGGSGASTYHPTGSTAKDALSVALTSWKSGTEKPGTIEGRTPKIQVQDVIWESGKKLKDFEIGEEHSSKDGPTRFSVQLTIEGEAAAQQAEYYVLGKDPLWVLRDKDYQKMTGMGSP